MPKFTQKVRKYQYYTHPAKPALDMRVLRARRWIKTFSARMERPETGMALQKVALQFLRKVIPRTPVLTGRARAAWTVYFDKKGVPHPPLASTRGQVMRLGRGGLPRRGRGGEDVKTLDASAIEEGKRLGMVIEATGVGKFQFITIINAVPYIVKLEYGPPAGGSYQAPHGMVRITIKEMRVNLAKAGDLALRKAAITASTHYGGII